MARTKGKTPGRKKKEIKLDEPLVGELVDGGTDSKNGNVFNLTALEQSIVVERHPREIIDYAKGTMYLPLDAKKTPLPVHEIARAYTSQALMVMADLMLDPEQHPEIRRAAANDILDRGWGKAPMTLGLKDLGKVTEVEEDGKSRTYRDKLEQLLLRRLEAREKHDSSGQADADGDVRVPKPD